MAERTEAWFELHRYEPPVLGDPVKQVPWFSPEYCAWMAQHPGTVWMADVVAEIKNSKAYPVESMIRKYGPYFFTSSLAWMFAMALEEPDVEEIGLWGVDMSATEEWGQQRAGCHHFIDLAKRRGIKVTVPYESDLLQPPMLYGIGESEPMKIKLTARRKELENRLANAEAGAQRANSEILFVRGALDDLNYIWMTWAQKDADHSAPYVNALSTGAEVIGMRKNA